MTTDAFGFQTIETGDDWKACEALQEYAVEDLHCRIFTGDEGYYGEICETEAGDAIAFIREFPTFDELTDFVGENSPNLEILDD